MLIGNKQTIAVEYELNENHGNAWMFGKICYWIDGTQVGDYELGTSLRDVFSQLKYLVHDSGNRDGIGLCALSPEEIFNTLDKALYSKTRNSDAELFDTPARFEIGMQVDVFDQWKIFLIDCSSYSIALFKMLKEKNVHFARIPKGDFDNVIRELYYDLETIYESVATS
jgi:hypothetical protein